MKSLFIRFPFLWILLAAGMGLLIGISNVSPLVSACSLVAEIFIRVLKLLSLPIIFLSIFVTIAGMDSGNQAQRMLRQIATLTLFTTLIAASVALGLFLLFDPSQAHIGVATQGAAKELGLNYWDHLLSVVPQNFVQPFVEGNVIAILIIALVLGFATLTLPAEQRLHLHVFCSSLHAVVMKVTQVVARLIPIAVCAFMALFVKELNNGFALANIGLYLATLMSANAIQALVVLPLLLKVFGISPIALAKGMLPALNVAFFSKSSCCAMPVAIQCAEENMNISPKVSRVTFPLCTTINMNACAAFILITTLFVSQSNGIAFSPWELASWVFIATIAAIGNAGVPMGCYFLTSALLTTMDVPLTLMGVILPFYAVIDMFETAINIWSDASIAAIVNKRQA